jgi:hypothetical protein
MINCLPPEELERFAALEQEMASLKAEMQALCQAVRDRKLTDWQELTDAEELASWNNSPLMDEPSWNNSPLMNEPLFCRWSPRSLGS